MQSSLLFFMIQVSSVVSISAKQIPQIGPFFHPAVHGFLYQDNVPVSPLDFQSKPAIL